MRAKTKGKIAYNVTVHAFIGSQLFDRQRAARLEVPMSKAEN